MAALSFNSVLIGSENPKGLVDFYSKIFGEPAWEGGDFVGWQAGNGFVTVGPHSDVSGRATQPERVIIAFETTDVQGEFDRIKDLGATVVQAPYNPGEAPEVQLATLADPDGNYFQLASPFPMEG